jgi:hypothetical protein
VPELHFSVYLGLVQPQIEITVCRADQPERKLELRHFQLTFWRAFTAIIVAEKFTIRSDLWAPRKHTALTKYQELGIGSKGLSPKDSMNPEVGSVATDARDFCRLSSVRI